MLDCFTRYVWAGLYTSKIPVTAVQILNNHALPFFEEHGVTVHTVTRDNGRDYCGRSDRHPYELLLQLEDIEHRHHPGGQAPNPTASSSVSAARSSKKHLRIKGRHDLVRDRRGDAEGPGRVS